MSDRPPLNRDVVLAAAVQLADDEGVDAVSMRALAQRLDVVPMALYKHVTSKEDLVSGMVDVVIAGFSEPAPSSAEDWKQSVRDAILGARRSVQAHPWVRRAIETRTVRTPAVLAHMERLTSTLLAAGLSPDLTHHAMHVLGNRIWGFSPELFNESGPAPAGSRSSAPQPDPDDYPGILTVAADAARRRPGATGCDEEFEFTFALDLILDAVQRLHDDGWSSAVPQE